MLDHLITLANWGDPAFNHWAFQHVDQVLPTAYIGRHGTISAPFTAEKRSLLDLPVAGGPVGSTTVGGVLHTTETDAFLVLHDGVLVHESYTNAMTAHSKHLLMSITKS